MRRLDDGECVLQALTRCSLSGDNRSVTTPLQLWVHRFGRDFAGMKELLLRQRDWGAVSSGGDSF